MKFKVNVVKNRFSEIAAKLPISAEVIVNGRHGPRMQEAARRRSRVKSGTMRDGWIWQPTGQGRGRLINDVPYAGVHEYGYPPHNISAQPMGRPAFEEIEPDIIRDFEHLESLLG